MATWMKLMVSLVAIVVFLCALQIGSTDGKLLCGNRACSNMCLNGTCEKFLYECRYGCKSGLKNVSACPTTTQKHDDGSNAGLVAGIVVAVVVVVIIAGIIVAVLVYKRRKANSAATPNPVMSYDNKVNLDNSEMDPHDKPKDMD